MSDVFISYASADRKIVSPIAQALSDLGLDVWFDQKLSVGEHWDEEIAKELQSALTVVVCWSATSVKSGWVIHEATFAQQKKNLISVYIEETSAPGPHARIQGIKLVGWKGEPNTPPWRQLLVRLEALLNRQDLMKKEEQRAAALSDAPSVTLVPGVQLSELKLLYGRLDNAQKEELLLRYDFSQPSQDVSTDETGALWVDYVGNIAGGYPDDFTIPYLLGRDEITLESGVKLRQGQILILGGSQVDPNQIYNWAGWVMDLAFRWPLFADFHRYRMRRKLMSLYRTQLIEPFNKSATTAEPKQKLFALPGPGDRYDGLVAFDNLFCSSRGKAGAIIGASQCVQHRSYWHIRLPHDWWIWGIDIAFDEPFDREQISYFHTIAEQMSPASNLLLLISDPMWLMSDRQGEDEEENFFKIVTVARLRGVRVCAAIASGISNYSRYYAHELDVQFLAAGAGGGSPLEPTHVLKNAISIRWPELAVDDVGSETADAPEIIPGEHDMRLKRPGRSQARPGTGGSKPLPPQAPKVYPAKARSYLLSLRNLAFPFKNPMFALGIGIIYWLAGYQLQTLLASLGTTETAFSMLFASANLVVVAIAVYLFLFWYVDAIERPRLRRFATKLVVATSHFSAHACAIGFLTWLGASSYSVLMIAAGALVGGSIWGLYWVVTMLFGRMHSEDAFAALRIKEYRNFLRLKFDPDRLTIYTLAVDAPLRRGDWIRFPKGRLPAVHNNPASIPSRPISVRTIEHPIVISGNFL